MKITVLGSGGWVLCCKDLPAIIQGGIHCLCAFHKSGCGSASLIAAFQTVRTLLFLRMDHDTAKASRRKGCSLIYFSVNYDTSTNPGSVCQT